MSPSTSPVHPIVKLKAFGITDRALLISVAYVFVITAALLIVRIYIFASRSKLYDAVPYLWWAWFAAPIVSVAVVAGLMWLLRSRRHARLRSLLSVRSESPSFLDLEKQKRELVEKAGLVRPVEIRLDVTTSIPNARVRVESGNPVILASYGLLHRGGERSDNAGAVLGHEISHVEAADYGFGTWYRWLVRLGGLGLATLIVVALCVFLVRKFDFHWLEEGPRFWAPILFGVAGWLLMTLGSLQYLVDRELLHDLRACQLLGSRDPLISILQDLSVSHSGLWNGLRDWAKHFIALHPTPQQRIRSVRRLEIVQPPRILNSLIIGGMMFLFPLAIGLVLSDLRVPQFWTSTATIIGSTITLTLLITPETARFGVFLADRSRQFLQVPLFCVWLVLGSILAGTPLFLSLSFAGRASFLFLLGYAAKGGLLYLVAYLGITLMLSYTRALRASLRFDGWRGKAIDGCLILGAFVIVFLLYILVGGRQVAMHLKLVGAVGALGTIVVLTAVTCALGGCRSCGSSRTNVLWLAPECTACKVSVRRIGRLDMN